MNVWMELKRALTVMDLATRNWGRELELDECGVMVLALLGEGGPSPECDLAASCGRVRPQVHRALMVLEERGYAARVVVSGRTRSWGLTERGRKLWGCLERGIREFEKELEARVDLPAHRAALQRIVTIFLNRPRANGGWRFGLYVPLELLKMPIGVAAAVEGLLPTRSPPPEVAAPAVRPPPGPWTEPWSPAELEFFKFYWEQVERQQGGDVSDEEAGEGHDVGQCP